MPVRVLASRSGDILNALELAETFSLDLILEGAIEAHLVADKIADAEVPVVVGGVDHSGLRRNDLLRRAIRDHGAALSEAGVSWTAGSGSDSAARARFVILNAQLAAAHDRQGDALKTVTADAADSLRVSDKIGRLRPGLLADFVLWSGDPLDPASTVRRVYVGGTLVYEATDKTKEKNWSLLPEPDDVGLYLAYMEMFDRMDTDPLALPSDDDVIAAVSADQGVPPEAVEQAIDVVLTWMFDEA